MELKNFLHELEAINDIANELSKLISSDVEIFFNEENGFTLHVTEESSFLYTSCSDTVDELWNEINALMVGAKLAKGIEV